MNLIKKYGLTLIVMIGIILFFSFFAVTLNYTNIISRSTLAIFKIMIVVTSFFIGGFIMGKRSNKKGWLTGVKIGSMLTIIFIIFNLLFFHSFQLKYLLYYLILISSSILGSIIGINKKEQD